MKWSEQALLFANSPLDQKAFLKHLSVQTTVGASARVSGCRLCLGLIRIVCVKAQETAGIKKCALIVLISFQLLTNCCSPLLSSSPWITKPAASAPTC